MGVIAYAGFVLSRLETPLYLWLLLGLFSTSPDGFPPGFYTRVLMFQLPFLLPALGTGLTLVLGF